MFVGPLFGGYTFVGECCTPSLNIAISDILLKTRFLGLDICRRKYPCQLSRLKHYQTKAFEICIFCRGASLWTPITGRPVRRPQSIYGPLDRKMMELELCRWKFSHKETLQQTFFERSWILPAQTAISRFCATNQSIKIYFPSNNRKITM